MTRLALALLLAASPAMAQQQCGPRHDVASHLHIKFGEAPVGAGLMASGALIEFWASPDGATWTSLRTSPNGVTCITASGVQWMQAIPRPAGVPG